MQIESKYVSQGLTYQSLLLMLYLPTSMRSNKLYLADALNTGK